VLPNLAFNDIEILAFALVFLRVSSFLISWPVFSIYSVPAHLKVLLSLLISMVIFPVLDRHGLGGQGFEQNIAWLAGKEVLTGLCLGFMTRLFFFGVAIGGSFIATSAGLANAQIYNPVQGGQSTTVEQFYATIATLLFLALNGHHYFISGLVQSFDSIPLSISGTEIALVVNKFSESGLILQSVTEAGIKIAAPVLVAAFLMNVVMGVIGKAVPQINVMVTSMPVNFMTGLMIMIVSIPVLIYELDRELYQFTEMFFRFMKAH
jgi:flagellar biosynthesis protein FliR